MTNITTHSFEHDPHSLPAPETHEAGYEKELSEPLGESLAVIDRATDEARRELPSQDPNSLPVVEATQQILLHNAENAIIEGRPREEVIDTVEAASTFGLLRYEGMLPGSDDANVIEVMEAEGLGDELKEVERSFEEKHVVIGTVEAAPEMKKILDAHPDINTETDSDADIELIEAPRPDRADLGKPEADPKLEDFEVNAEKRKEDIDALFEKSLELCEIGSKEQYEAYLSTVFPESKIQAILYHGTASKFEEFNTRPEVRNGSKFANEAAFFTADISLAQQYTRETGELKRVLLDIHKPMRRTRVDGLVDIGMRSVTPEIRKDLEAQGYDSVVNLRYVGEVGVFESDKIHTLGSQKDIKKFTDYVDTLKTHAG